MEKAMFKKTGIIMIIIGMVLPFIDLLNVDHLINHIYTYTIIGIAMIMIGLIPLVKEKVTGKVNNSFTVPANRKLTVNVLGVSRGLRASENEKEEFYIVAEGIDDKGNKKTFTSEPLDYYPGKQVIGKQAEVIFNSDDEDDYHLEISRLLN